MDQASVGSIICKYNVGSNVYWVPAILTLVSGNVYQMGVYSNVSTYSMTQNQLITFWIDQVNPDAYHGIFVTNI